jgi:two-component system response regulator HydG
MERVVSMLQRFAAHDLSVLVTGESGVGKELIAEELVRASPRANRPFVRFNCAALTPELADAELFGHRRGAFTGAVRDHNGVFREADGGTLFLDEIAELHLTSQAKLLRVLQQGEIRPVGTSTPVHVDVRIIAATNRSLPEEVAAGRFRQDLFYRLNAAPLAVPPLRERPDDILALAREFVGLLPRELNLPPVELPVAAFDPLLSYSWPGNVRELRNAIQRALVLSQPGELDPMFLPGSTVPTNADDQGSSLRDQMVLQERSALVQAIARAGGNRTLAAQALGIARSTLYAKLVRHGLATECEVLPFRAPSNDAAPSRRRIHR